MDQDRSSANEFLKQRLGLMGELAKSLERAQAAVLRSDARQINFQAVQQRKICEELRRLTSQFTATPVSSTAPSEHSSGQLPKPPVQGAAYERWRALTRELAKVEAEVAHLNRNYSALLRRARRTGDIFCRVLENSGVTYVLPASQSKSVMPARG